jgi:hypothetical protein
MTAAYNPRTDWARDDRVSHLYATQPLLGPLVDGDLCDIRIGTRYCHQPAVREVSDANGATRLLCGGCEAKYFPNGEQR